MKPNVRTIATIAIIILLIIVSLSLLIPDLQGQFTTITVALALIGTVAAVLVLSRVFTPSHKERKSDVTIDRAALINAVRNVRISGITGELEQALGGLDDPINLQKNLLASGRKTTLVGGTRLPDDLRMIDIIDQTTGSMLVIGRPGSGKSIALLELTRDLLERAESNNSDPIPLMFELSSWRPGVELTDWLVEELFRKYYFPRNQNRAIVAGDIPSVLLLDGLDETGQHYTECLKAVEIFRNEYSGRIVVSNRQREATEQAESLRFYHVVELLPLTDGQVLDYAEQASLDISLVQVIIQDSDALVGNEELYEYDLAHTPLFLSLMSTAYAGLASTSLPTLGSPQARRKHLFTTYISRVLRDYYRKTDRWSPNQFLCWIQWLASRMHERNISLFLIEHLQPNWSEREPRVRWITGAIIGLLQGGCVGSAMWLLVRPAFGVAFGLFVAVAGGLFGGLWEIEPIEQVRFSLNSVLTYLRQAWKMSVIIVLLMGLAIGLNAVLNGLLAEINTAVIAGLFMGAIGYLFGGLIEGIEVSPLSGHYFPNQGIIRSYRNFWIVWLIYGLAGILIGGISAGLLNTIIGSMNDWLISGILGGLLIAMHFGGGTAVIKHVVLRSQLTLAGYMPPSYASFLNDSADLAVLRRVGGGYAFIHNLLRDHFTQLTDEDIERLSQPPAI